MSLRIPLALAGAAALILVVVSEADASAYRGASLHLDRRDPGGYDPILGPIPSTRDLNIQILWDSNQLGLGPADEGRIIDLPERVNIHHDQRWDERFTIQGATQGWRLEVLRVDPTMGIAFTRVVDQQGNEAQLVMGPHDDPHLTVLEVGMRFPAGTDLRNNAAASWRLMAHGHLTPEIHVAHPGILTCMAGEVCTHALPLPRNEAGEPLKVALYDAENHEPGIRNSSLFLHWTQPVATDGSAMQISSDGSLAWDLRNHAVPEDLVHRFSMLVEGSFRGMETDDGGWFGYTIAWEIFVDVLPDPDSPPAVHWMPPTPCGGRVEAVAGLPATVALAAIADGDGLVSLWPSAVPGGGRITGAPANPSSGEAVWDAVPRGETLVSIYAQAPGSREARCVFTLVGIELDAAFGYHADSAEGGAQVSFSDRTRWPPGMDGRAWTWTVSGAVQSHASDPVLFLEAGVHEVCLEVQGTWQDHVLTDQHCDIVRVLDAVADADMDGIADLADNCPSTPNRDQRDTDGDGVGDDCQAAFEKQGTSEAAGPSAAQVQCPGPDMDRDGIGDACDADADGDRTPDALDNCPGIPNPDQADGDGDGRGAACEVPRQVIRGALGANGQPSRVHDIQAQPSPTRASSLALAAAGAAAVVFLMVGVRTARRRD